MPTLTEVLREQTSLDPPDIEWLHLLVGDWHLLSDLSFADLVLWVAVAPRTWRAVAHIRPTTGPMVFYEDIVGHTAYGRLQAAMEEAYDFTRLVREPEPEWRDNLPTREEAVPVVRSGRPIAVLTRHTNLAMMRTPSRLELTYLASADALVRMVATGDFPTFSPVTGRRRGAPRVGDGVIRTDAGGRVVYASPNAVSALHRLGHFGDLTEHRLLDVVSDVLRHEAPADETLTSVLTGGPPWWTEIETRSASVSVRALPLVQDGERTGAILLVRDVSELRRREQELLTKDATIREIHHRVKNNLQTVAALLRMQARRLPEGESRGALDEAERRVATIALVHETLARGLDETVDFDEIAGRLLANAIEVARRGAPVGARKEGSFGRLRAEDATSLAMVVTELVHNAVEHGLARSGGQVVLCGERSADGTGELLTVVVTDDGDGLPEGFSPGASGLGTQIVLSLVQDLRGSIGWTSSPHSGTQARFVARLRPMGEPVGAV